jgi:hypothetical protein
VRRFIASLVLALAIVSVSNAAAEPIAPRDTARVLAPGRWSAGLMAPIAVGVTKQVELDTQLASWGLLSPNLSVRIELARLFGGDVVATGEYGLSMPTGAMRLLSGYLFPTWATSGQKPGWVLVPSAGLWVSGGTRGVWTGRMETTIGVPLGENPATPLETYAPIDLAFAPALSGYRVRFGGAYDYPLFDWLRAKAALQGFLVRPGPYPQRSPLYVSAEVGLEFGLGKVFRIALGAIWYNYDQREKVLLRGKGGRLSRVGVRSNDFFPTLDLIVRP